MYEPLDKECTVDLLKAWNDWEPGDSAPYVLDVDADELHSRRWQRRTVAFTLEQAKEIVGIYGEEFSDSRLHLGLYPVPFAGNLENASIYVLLANPSANIGSYKEQAEYRRQRQIGQESTEDLLTFLGKGLKRYVRNNLGLGKTAKIIAEHGGVSDTDILEDVAIIELSPYWSRSFIDGAHKLPSANLAVKFVEESIVPRVRDGEAILVVTRRVKDWDRNQGLPSDLVAADHIVRYGPGESRSASLSPRSRGGKAILRHFGIPTN